MLSPTCPSCAILFWRPSWSQLRRSWAQVSSCSAQLKAKDGQIGPLLSSLSYSLGAGSSRREATRIWIWLNMYICIYVYVGVYVYACVYIYILKYISVHTYIPMWCIKSVEACKIHKKKRVWLKSSLSPKSFFRFIPTTVFKTCFFSSTWGGWLRESNLGTIQCIMTWCNSTCGNYHYVVSP